MGLSFYYVPRSKTTLLWVTHCNTIQTVTICSLQLENTKCLWKKVNRIWKNDQNVRITPPILGNGIFILLYSKVLNHPSWSDTPWYHSNNHNLVSATEKHYTSLKEIIRIGKNYQNIRITRQIFGNGTFILLYSKVQNHPTWSDTPQYLSNSHNLVSATGKH